MDGTLAQIITVLFQSQQTLVKAQQDIAVLTEERDKLKLRVLQLEEEIAKWNLQAGPP